MITGSECINKTDEQIVALTLKNQAYQNLNDFDLNFKFSNWIYSIAHNTTISAFRKKKVRPQSVSWEDKDLDNILKSTLDVEDASLQKLTYKHILKIINQLPLKYKDVLVLKFVEGKDYQEISDILHKPMGTIATLINRAKKSLKQELEKEDIKL